MKVFSRVDPRSAKFYCNMIKCINKIHKSLYPTTGDEGRVGVVYKSSKDKGNSQREI